MNKKFLSILLLIFSFSNIFAQKNTFDLNILTGFKTEDFTATGIPVSFEVEYMPSNFFSTYVGYEKFSVAYFHPSFKPYNFMEHISYDLFKLGLFVFPINFNDNYLGFGGALFYSNFKENRTGHVYLNEELTTSFVGNDSMDQLEKRWGTDFNLRYKRILNDRYKLGINLSFTNFTYKPEQQYISDFIGAQIIFCIRL